MKTNESICDIVDMQNKQNMEKDSPEMKSLIKCRDTIQHILMEICKKINNLQFQDCALILKDKMVLEVFKILNANLDFKEEFFYISNFLKIVNKLHEIFPKYYNVETDAVIESINDLSTKKLFNINSKDSFLLNSFENKYRGYSAGLPDKIKTSSNYSIENLLEDKNDKNILTEKNLYTEKNLSLERNISTDKNKLLLEYIIKYIECIRVLLEIMKKNMELFGKLHDIYKNVYETIHNSTSAFNEDVFKDLIMEYESFLETSLNRLNIYSDSEYLQDTFFPLMIQIVEDINTIKSLLKSYKSSLYLDPINTISNLLISKKNIENLKQKYKNIFDVKLYIFFIQFLIDNTHKANILFKTYFENKKMNLLLNFNEQKLKHALPNDIQIKDEVFQFKSNFYIDKYMKKCFDENLDISYFVIVFEKKKFLNIDSFDLSENFLKNFYFRSNSTQMFIEHTEELGLICIFHTVDSNFRGILLEIEHYYKGTSISENNLHNNGTMTKTHFNSFLVNQQNGASLAFMKNKVTGTKEIVLTHKISNFLFIAVKIKEKTPNDVVLLNELCKDFRVKFGDLHLFKTIFPLK